MPVTIGVFITPGRVKAPNDQALDRFNRSYEYDGLGDNYVRFLLEEILPEVETKKTADGRPIRLSRDGNDRCIAGASSGAICAFTAAWERPDSFRRVFSAIGTYVGLRGGNVYPTLIRKYEPKPIRVFLQDGSSDLNIYGGDWWMANQEMERALVFAGYEVNHDWGKGGHSGEHATRDLPRRHALALEGLAPAREGRRRVAADPRDPPARRGLDARRRGLPVHRGPGRQREGRGLLQRHPEQQGVQDRPRGQGQPVAPRHEAGQRPGVRAGRPAVRRRRGDEIIAYDPTGKPTVIADGFHGNDLVVRHDGGIYVTNPVRGPARAEQGLVHQPQGREEGRRHRA